MKKRTRLDHVQRSPVADSQLPIRRPMFHRRYGRREGFTLTHLLCTLILLTAFSSAAAPLFSSVLRVYWTADRSATRVSRYEMAIGSLRRDVWSATKIETVNSQRVQLTQAGATITWNIDDDGALVRTVNEGIATRWQEAGMSLRFSEDSGCLLLAEQGEDPALATRFFGQSAQIERGSK